MNITISSLKMTRIFRASLLCCFFMLCALFNVQSFAQELKTDSDVPDLNVFGIAETFTVRIAKAPQACPNGKLSFTFPTGIEYVPGSVKIGGQSVSDNGASINGGSVQISVPAGQSKDELIITMQGKAVCEALSLVNDKRVISYVFTGCGATQPGESNIINIRSAKLNVSVPLLSESLIGVPVSRSIKVENTGNAPITGVYVVPTYDESIERVNGTLPSGWSYDAQKNLYFYNGTIQPNKSVSFDEQVKLKSCGLGKSSYRAYYGQGAECAAGSSEQLAQNTIAIDKKLKPNIVITAASNPNILCLDQAYTHTWTIKNTGNAIASNVVIDVLAGNAAANIAGVSVSPTTASSVVANKVTIDKMAPGETRTITFTQHYPGTDKNATCSALESEHKIANTAYKLAYIHAESCDESGNPPAYSSGNDPKETKAGVTYRFGGQNIGEVDIVNGRPYQADFRIDDWHVPSEGVGAGAFFEIDIQLSDALAAGFNPSTIKIFNGQDYLLAGTDFIVTGTAPNFKLRINKGSSSWIKDDLNLGGGSWRLQFPLSVDCASPADAWYKIAGSLNKGGGCTDLIKFKCQEVALNKHCPINEGPCLEGVIKGEAKLKRVSLGYLDVNNDAIPDNTTPLNENDNLDNIQTRSFIGGDIIEISQKGTIKGTDWAEGGSFVVYAGRSHVAAGASVDIIKSTAVEKSGKLIVTRAGTEYILKDIPVTSYGTDGFKIDFAAATAGNLPIGFTGLKEGDVVIASLRLQPTTLNGKVELKVFGTEFWLNKAGAKLSCGGDYKATGYYGSTELKVVRAKNGFNIPGCSSGEEGAGTEIKFAVAGRESRNALFINEFRQITTPKSISFDVPSTLVMSGYVVELHNNKPGNHLSKVIKLPATVTGRTETIDVAEVLRVLKNGSAGKYLDEGFHVIVRPIVSATCDALPQETIKVSLTVDGTFRYSGKDYIQQTDVTIVGEPLEFNTDNNKLSFRAPAATVETYSNEVKWVIEANNSSAFRSFDNLWLAKNNGDAKINKVQQVTALTNYTAVGAAAIEVDGIYQLGSIAPKSVTYYEITATFDICGKGGLNIYTGADCQGYPTTIADAKCKTPFATKLEFVPQQAELLTTPVKQPIGSARPALCEGMEYIVEIHNTAGEAKELEVRIPLRGLQGLSYVISTAKATNDFAIAPSLVDRDAAFVSIADEHVSTANEELLIKIPTSILAKLGRGSRFYIGFQLVAEGCDFKSGQRIGITPAGKNFCGSPITSDRIRTAGSNRIILDGAPEDEPIVKLASSVSVNVAQVGEKLTASYSSTIENIGEGEFSHPITGLDSKDKNTDPNKKVYVYKYAVKLPADWKFESPNTVFPAAKAKYLEIDTIKGYIFEINEDIPSGTSITIDKAQLTYTGDAALLACETKFAPIVEELFTLFTPKSKCNDGVVCESELITAQNWIEFNLAKPETPEGEAEQAFCETTKPTLADLVLDAASVSILDWFEDATSTVRLPLNTPLITGKTYYAANSLVDGSVCMSDRFAVTVRVDLQPSAIAGIYAESFNSGTFTLAGNAPTVGQIGEWTVISTSKGKVTFVNKDLYNTKVTIENGAEVVLQWTVTNGTCEASNTATLKFNRLVDLGITKTAAKQDYIVGDTVTYSIVVTNNGPGVLFAGDKLSVVENFPIGLVNPTVSSADGDLDETTNAFTLKNDLVVNGTVTLTVTAKVANNFTGTSLKNTVSVQPPAGVTDIDHDNNEAEETINVTRQIDLGITKTATPEPVVAGSELTYTITIKNNGPATLNKDEIMTVTETLPVAGFINPLFTTVDAHVYNAKTGAFTLGKAFEKGETIVLTVKGLVDAAFRGDKLVNAVSVTPPSTVLDTNKTNDKDSVITNVVRLADLEVAKVADKTEVIAGEKLSYNITVTNNGLSTLFKGEEIGFNETLPVELTDVKMTYPAGAVYTAATKKLSLVADMKAGDSFKVTVEGIVAADFIGTSITNTVVVATPTGVTDSDTTNNTSTVITDVVRDADLGVKKVVDKATLTAGENLTYTITVTNHGTSTLLKDEVLSLKEQLPLGLNSVTYEATGGVYKAANNTFKLAADFPKDSTVSLKVFATVDANYKGTALINRVEVTAPDGVDDKDPNNNTDSTTTTVGRSADLAVVKLANKTEVVAGEQLEYTITVKNNGASTLLANELVGFDEQLPVGLSNVTYKEVGGTYNAKDKTFKLATDLIAGASFEVKVFATVNADYVGKTLVNTVKVATPTGVTDSDTTNNDAKVTTEVVRKADLAVQKVADKTTITAGEALNYTITVTNNGVSTLVVGDVVGLDEQLPNALTNVSFTSAGGTYDAKAKTFTLNKALATGESFEVKVSSTVAANYTASTIVNTVKVTTPKDVIDEDPTNNESTVTTQVERKADLGVEKFTDKSAVVAGEDIAYRIVVKNNGNSSILKGERIGLVETLPAAVENVRFTSTDGTYDFASSSFTLNNDLEKGGSIVLQVTARVKSSTAEGHKLINHVKVSTPAAVIDEDPTNDESEVISNVIRIADLKVEKTVLNSKPLIGLETTFTVTVTNNGPSDATGTTVFDKLKSGYEFVSATTSKGTYDAGTGLWTIGDMPLGAKATMSMIVRVLATGDYANTAIVDLVETDNIIENNEVTITPTPIPAPPIAVDDAVTTKSNTPVDIFILDNDKPGLTNSPLVPGSVEIITQPKNGTITIDADGKVIYTPNHGYVGQDDFVYRVKDELGFWSNEATVTITIVANDLFIPNVFTPNGDGKNDNFVIIGIEGYERVAITIVNRWGNEVYRNENYDNTWSGKGLNEGTYYYIITPHKNGKSEVIKGWVLIKKR